VRDSGRRVSTIRGSTLAWWGATIRLVAFGPGSYTRQLSSVGGSTTNVYFTNSAGGFHGVRV
jgi:hypothetical protein